MSYLIGIGISLFVSAIIAFFWVKGIDYMKENHPDYKGEDFLNWGEETAPWETNNKEEDTNRT